jgi:hypothetical protein
MSSFSIKDTISDGVLANIDASSVVLKGISDKASTLLTINEGVDAVLTSGALQTAAKSTLLVNMSGSITTAGGGELQLGADTAANARFLLQALSLSSVGESQVLRVQLIGVTADTAGSVTLTTSSATSAYVQIDGVSSDRAVSTVAVTEANGSIILEASLVSAGVINFVVRKSATA